MTRDQCVFELLALLKKRQHSDEEKKRIDWLKRRILAYQYQDGVELNERQLRNLLNRGIAVGKLWQSGGFDYFAGRSVKEWKAILG